MYSDAPYGTLEVREYCSTDHGDPLSLSGTVTYFSHWESSNALRSHRGLRDAPDIGFLDRDHPVVPWSKFRTVLWICAPQWQFRFRSGFALNSLVYELNLRATKGFAVVVLSYKFDFNFLHYTKVNQTRKNCLRLWSVTGLCFQCGGWRNRQGLFWFNPNYIQDCVILCQKSGTYNKNRFRTRI